MAIDLPQARPLMLMRRLTHAASLVGYTLLMLLLFLPYLRGDVVAPTRLGTQFGIHDEGGAMGSPFENAKFGDYSNVFISEVDAFMNGPRSGAVALWSAQNELGRPLYHVSGFSPIYFPASLLQTITHSPARFITVWTLSMVFLSGLFILLFCRQSGLTPLAGMTAAIAYAASPAVLYWLAFPMFVASWCWGAGCAWALRRMADRADLISWVSLGFCMYSLLMTSYPQLTVYQAYLLGIYAAVLLVQRARVSSPSVWRFALGASSAGLLALALAAPMIADLLSATLQSSRVRPEATFFLASLPQISSFSEAGRAFTLAFMPNLFGVGTRPDYPAAYNGLSAALLTSSLIVAALVARVRGGRSWWIGVGVLLAVATVKPIFLFGVAHLGLGLSRTDPLSMLLLPCVMLQAHAVDSLERGEARSWLVTMVSTLCMLVLIAGSVAFGVRQGWPIVWPQVAISAAIVVLAMGACWGRYGTIPLLLASACWIALAAAPLLLRQDPVRIHAASPLVDAVKARLHDHARIAVAAPGISSLSPNFNALVGVSSVHSYDSLSSRRYQEFVRRLGGETTTYGRWNDKISPDYAGVPFWMSDVALVLSPVRLDNPSLSCSTQIDLIWLCDVPQHMGRTLQLDGDFLRRPATDVSIGDPRTLPTRPSRVVRDDGDAFDVVVSPGPPSLLVISQQYHPDWHAKAFSEGRWSPTPTPSINGFFQGVVVPANTDKIAMTFLPKVRYAYLANYVWAFLLVLLVAKAILTWTPKSGHSYE